MEDHNTEKAIRSNSPYRGDVDINLASEGHSEPWSRRFVDSFKRDPNAAVTKASERTVAKGFDHEAATRATADSGLM